MADRIKFEVIDKEVREAFARLKASGDDMTPALNVVGRTIRDRVRLGFKFSKSPYGEAWAPLRIRKGKPLVNSGRFRSSIDFRVGGDGASEYVDVGTNFGPLPGGKSIAAVHQFGATIVPKQAKFLRFMGANGYITKKVVIPARPFLPIVGDDLVMPDAWSTAVIKALKRHFDAAAKTG